MARLLAIGFLALAAAARAQTWSVVRLPTGPDSVATSVNNAGQVVGQFAYDSNAGIDHAFLWQNGVFRDISPGVPVGMAYSVSNAGVACGRIDVDDNYHDIAVYWTNGGQASHTVTDGVAYCVNNVGIMAGSTDGKGGVSFTPGEGSAKLPDFGGGCGAYGINDAGQVVGWAVPGPPYFFQTAATWKNGVPTLLNGLYDDTESIAFAISNTGDIVGSSWSGFEAYDSHAVLWRGGTAIDLGAPRRTLASRATDVNDLGQVVGFGFGATSNANNRGFFWENGRLTDLTRHTNDLALNRAITFANGVNDLGWIAGVEHQYAPKIDSAVVLIPMYGDADGDFTVDIGDVTAVLRTSAGLDTLPCTWIADVSPKPSANLRGFGDGKLTTADAVRILRKVQGREPIWP